MEFFWLSFVLAVAEAAAPVDWIERSPNGAHQFGYATGDEGGHYRTEAVSADNTVAGKYGFRDPGSGANLETTYTSGRRGFRARGPHIARRMGLSQLGGPNRPKDDGQYHPELDHIFDPTEDRGYDFQFRTRDVVKEEHADARGDVRGRYSYVDDVGGKHTVDYTAGANTGFNVLNPVPDTFAQAQGSPLYFHGKGPGSKARGYTAIQKSLDGSYKFAASGPDHKRTEISDSQGNRRGSYTYLDDKGQQRTVEYIAGPNIGYQIINNRRPLVFGPTGTPVLGSPSPSPFYPDATPSPFFPTSPNPLDPYFPSSPNPLDWTPTTPSTTPSLNPDTPSSGWSPTSPPSGWPSSTTKPWSPTSPSSGWPSSTTKPWSPNPATNPDWPSSTPSWLDLDVHSGPNDFNSLHHQLFPERNQTLGVKSCCGQSWRTGPKRSSPYRGRVKFGQSEDEQTRRPLALRAHVQNIDVVPEQAQRYPSPGDALEMYGDDVPKNKF